MTRSDSFIAASPSPNDAARRYAASLLCTTGAGDLTPRSRCASDALSLWAGSGAMALSGRADGPPELAPGPLALAALGAGEALAILADDSAPLNLLDAPALLAERAAIGGLRRRGDVSPGGHCRMIRASDGWLAVNLARPDDTAMLPAWLEVPFTAHETSWNMLARVSANRNVEELLLRARLLGLPVAHAVPPPTGSVTWLRGSAPGQPKPAAGLTPPRVLDMSTLWAGPLCTHLLQLAGAEVIKLESPTREDGARRGPADFFDLLNAGKRSVALDLSRPTGVRLLNRLIDEVDIVVESARPRALAQLGIDAVACVARRPGLTWLGITGYGRADPEAHWVAFGDDAAVAAGATIWRREPTDVRQPDQQPTPLFCGDAIADPLTGLHAAVAALASHRSGGGRFLDVSLRAVTAHALAWRNEVATPDAQVEATREPADEDEPWQVRVGSRVIPVRRPRARAVRERAALLGADTNAMLETLSVQA